MRIRQKLIAGYIVIALFVGLVGLYGLIASKEITKSFEGGESHFRSIVTAATELNSYAKRAEGHLILYLMLGNTVDREKFFKRHASVVQQMEILEEKVRVPEAKEIVAKIEPKAEELLIAGKALLEDYDDDMAKTGRFEPEEHKALILQLHDAASDLRAYGITLANLETDFLNRQTAITAATEASSYVKRAESHLMLYLNLNSPVEKEKFFEQYSLLAQRISVLKERVRVPEGKEIVAKIEPEADEFLRAGKSLLKAYDDDIVNVGRFKPKNHKALMLQFHNASSSVRRLSVRLADLKIALEAQTKDSAVGFAESTQRKIVANVILALAAALAIGYLISRYISSKLISLKESVAEVGRGKFDTEIKVKSKDEIGELAVSFGEMARDLQRTTVSRDYFDKIISNVADSLIVLSLEGTIELVNRATCEMLGYEAEELVGQPFDMVSEREIPPGWPGLDEPADISPTRSVEKEYQSKDGVRIPVLYSEAAITGDKGDVLGFVLLALDITERKRLERELLLAEKMASLGTLSWGAAHEILNPLSIIKVQLHIHLTNESLAPEWREDSRTMMDQVERISDIIDGLTTFSRQMKGEWTPVEIPEVLGRAKESLSQKLRESGVETVEDFPEGPLTVMGNMTLLHKAFEIIFDNALRAMPSGGTLTVRAEEVRLNGKPWVHVDVTDTGEGIAPEHLSKVFDPFFTTREVGEGKGLGLSIALGVAKDHGGTISVESTWGEGATFTVHLPLQPAA